MIGSTDDEIEAFRLQRLAEMLSESGETRQRLEARYAPGTFGCHEALHVASLLMEEVDRHLAEHPAVALNPDWYRLAVRAQEALFELYQEIGAAHV
jgi:hypothetical protein